MLNMNMTQRQVRQAITPEMIRAAQHIEACKAIANNIRPIVRGYQEEILKRRQFKIADEWVKNGDKPEVILNPDFDYLMSEADLKEYVAELDAKKAELGFDLPEPGTCPLLIAEHNVIKAKWAFLKAIAPLLGINWKDIPVNVMDDFIETFYGLFRSVGLTE